jgi:MFS family permease
MSLYDEDSTGGAEPSGGSSGVEADPAAVPATTAEGELIVPDYGAPAAAAAAALPQMKTTWFGVASASGPLILCHFVHYNAWAIGSVPMNYVVNDIACSAHTNSACANSLMWQSILGFLNPAVQFLFAKMFADLSDTHGRKPFLLVACCAIFFYGLFFALSTNMWLLLFGYTLEGIFAVGFSSGQAYITDITTDSNGVATPNRAVSIAAYISVTQGATNLMGTLTALVMMEAFGITPQNTMLTIVALAVIEVPMLWFLVEESLPVERRRPFDRKQANPLGVMRSVFQRDPFFSRMMISFGLSSTGALFLSSTWVNFCDAALGWGALGSSTTIIIFGASLVFIPPPLVEVVGDVAAISLGFRIMIATYIVLVGIGWFTPYHGECMMADGSLVPGNTIASLDACRALPAIWAPNLGEETKTAPLQFPVCSFRACLDKPQ